MILTDGDGYGDDNGDHSGDDYNNDGHNDGSGVGDISALPWVSPVPAGIPLFRIAWETSGLLIKRMDLVYDDDDDDGAEDFLMTKPTQIIIIMM